MRIVKPRTDKEQEVTCGCCGATIGYYDCEVHKQWLPACIGRYHTTPPRYLYDYVLCPSCSHEIRLTTPTDKNIDMAENDNKDLLKKYHESEAEKMKGQPWYIRHKSTLLILGLTALSWTFCAVWAHYFPNGIW